MKILKNILVLSILLSVLPVSTYALINLIEQRDITSITSSGFGLAYDWTNDSLWVGDEENDILYRIDMASIPNIEQMVLILTGPINAYGLEYDGSTVLVCGNDSFIYRMNLGSGEGNLYRSAPDPWIGNQPLALDVINDAIYSGDWEVDNLGYAKPAQTGTWQTWGAADFSGLACAYNGIDSPQYLFAVNQNPTQAYLYVYALQNGIPQFPPCAMDPLPGGMSQINTGDCAYDGEYLYVLDNQPPTSYIYVLEWVDTAVYLESLGTVKALFK
jgi:hypothetical protein